MTDPTQIAESLTPAQRKAFVGEGRPPHDPERGMTIAYDHELKVWSPYFAAISNGTKPFEARKDDRGFQTGEVLWLREYDPNGSVECLRYTGNAEFARITYILRGGQFGVEVGHVVMGIELVEADTP